MHSINIHDAKRVTRSELRKFDAFSALEVLAGGLRVDLYTNEDGALEEVIEALPVQEGVAFQPASVGIHNITNARVGETVDGGVKIDLEGETNTNINIFKGS